MGVGILSHALKDKITYHLLEQFQNIRPWRFAFQDEGDRSDGTLPGYIPTWGDLVIIRECAKECFDEGHEEDSWNMEIYHLLLVKVIRGVSCHGVEPLDFMSW